jgi:hypothetical protein
VTVAFWLLTPLALLLALAQLAQALRVRSYYRPIDSDTARERPPVSLLILLQGDAAPGAAGWLAALRPAAANSPGDEGWLAFAHEDAAAGRLAANLLAAHPTAPVALLPLAGNAREAALAYPAAHARHPLVAIAAGEALGGAPLLDEAVRTAGGTDAGLTFALPHYVGARDFGGALLASFHNALIAPTFAALAATGSPRFAFAGLWAFNRSALAAALASAAHPVPPAARPSRSLSLEFSRQERRNRVLRRRLPVTLPKHAAWPALRSAWRALPLTGVPQRLLLLTSWSPLPMAALASLIGVLTPNLPTLSALTPLLVVASARIGALAILSRGGLRAAGGWRVMLATVVVEGALMSAIAIGVGDRRR